MYVCVYVCILWENSQQEGYWDWKPLEREIKIFNGGLLSLVYMYMLVQYIICNEWVKNLNIK